MKESETDGLSFTQNAQGLPINQQQQQKVKHVWPLKEDLGCSGKHLALSSPSFSTHHHHGDLHEIKFVRCCRLLQYINHDTVR